MEKSSEIRTGRHCVFAMHVHLVFVTKYRKNIFQKEHLDYMKELFEKLLANFEAELAEFNGESNHVHLLVNYPPKVCVSKLVNALKGTSSRMLKEKFPELKKHYWKNALWSPSYFAGSCGGAPLSIVKQYIESQDTPH
ncbi:MAG: IS200/IS605 family transposase [Desulfurella sp.]|uniref:IS200/IS605 family transposase n=1 Tax=Desulfurella sp. TaxID=1962857 RepID=UPI000CB07AFC|nr:IS200/IS605 family transposase [Desulfurella sp.]PMP88218.1 MAG: IS200/IS605 family transposase [Desulfurella sp.]